jgi:hypothetical protein
MSHTLYQALIDKEQQFSALGTSHMLREREDYCPEAGERTRVCL